MRDPSNLQSQPENKSGIAVAGSRDSPELFRPQSLDTVNDRRSTKYIRRVVSGTINSCDRSSLNCWLGAHTPISVHTVFPDAECNRALSLSSFCDWRGMSDNRHRDTGETLQKHGAGKHYWIEKTKERVLGVMDKGDRNAIYAVAIRCSHSYSKYNFYRCDD